MIKNYVRQLLGTVGSMVVGLTTYASDLSSFVEVDTSDPIGSFTIKKTKALDQSPNAQLIINVNDGAGDVASMTFSDDGVTYFPFTPAPYTTISDWTLHGEGLHTLYGNFRDKFGNLATFQSQIDIQPIGNALIVAGGGIGAQNTLFEATQYLTLKAISVFWDRGFSLDEIWYMNPSIEHDWDQDGNFDYDLVDEPQVTVENFGKAITEWAVQQPSTGPLLLYLVDHGGDGKFQLGATEVLTASDLDNFLDYFQAETNRPIIVVIEACKSGTFVNYLTDYNRVIITSTDSKDAYISTQGYLSFSQFYLENLLNGKNHRESFQQSVTSLKQIGRPYNRQTPQLWENSTIASSYLGKNVQRASSQLTIVDHVRSMSILAGQEIDLWTTVSGLAEIKEVSAHITSPHYFVPLLGGNFHTPQINTPILHLEKNEGRHSGKYVFDTNGAHRIFFTAKDESNQVVHSYPITIEVTGGKDLRHWQSVSFPDVYFDSPENFLGHFDDIITMWAWDNGTWRIWSPHHTIKELNEQLGSNFLEIRELDPQKGYWLNTKRALEFGVGQGSSFDIELTSGWNFVSVSQTQQSVDVEKFMSQYPNAQSIWNYFNGEWYTFFKEETPHSFKTLRKLEVSKAYWIFNANNN